MNAVAFQEKKSKESKIYSLNEYLVREEKTVEKYEFYNGQIVKMPNAIFYHNLIATNTTFAVKVALLELSKKYLVVGDGQKVYIEQENVAVFPDALVVCEKPVYFKNYKSLITNPLLIIEVLSPSTKKYDSKTKFDLYKLLPSFKEYVLIDTRKHSVETRFREEEDLWRIKTVSGIDTLLTLRALENISISLASIYDDVDFI